MSLYRQPGRMRPLLIAIVAAAALLIGGGIGYAIGHGGQAEPSMGDALAQLREQLRPLAAGLELLPTEYPQSLEGSGNESAAVDGDLQRIRSALDATEGDLRSLDPEGTTRLAASIAALEQAIETQGPAAEVERLATAAQAALGDVPGGR